MLYLLVYVLLPLLGGCLFLVWGYYRLQRKPADLNAKQKLRLQHFLASWQLYEGTSSQTLQSINRCISTLTLFMFLGFGVGLIVVAFIMACIALFTTGALLAGNSSRGEPFAEAILLLLLGGCFLGELAGLKKLRREATGRITFGDLRRRRAADYRSLWLHLIPVLLGAVNTVVALICIASFHSSNMLVLLMNDTTVQLPVWLLLALPVISLLMVAGIEMGIGRIVRFPRLLVMAEPILAQRIDDMLRATMIGTLIGIEYCMVGSLQMAQFRLLITSFSVNSGVEIPDIISIWLLVSYIIGMILTIVGLGFGMTLQGHLGGSVSGWHGKGSKGGLRGTAAADR